MSEPYFEEPMDATNMEDGPSEWGWGPGLFPPGVAQNEGQKEYQDDFGDNMIPRTNHVGDFDDNYARMVADKRTDPTDPTSGRDFTTAGNPDRFGAQPPLVRSEPQRNQSERIEFEPRNGVDRKW